MDKTENNKAWFLVLPVLLLVAFNAIIPLMTVVNYSVQETFGDNVFFFEGVKWFQEVLRSERFHAALIRQLLFTGIILLIEIPLGVAIALTMPRKGPWVSVCLVLMALPLLIPWNVVGTICSLLRHGPSSWRRVLIARGLVTPPMTASVALFEFKKRSRASIKSARSTRAKSSGDPAAGRP